MFGIKEKNFRKGLSKLEVHDQADVEIALNTEKFCKTAADLRSTIAAAQIIIRPTPKGILWKFILGLADAIIEALQNKLNCPATPNGL